MFFRSREESVYDGLDLPDDPDVQQHSPGGIGKVWWVMSVLLVVLLTLAFLRLV